MKKAKIMLIAIGVLATVGGALAFKAQKFSLTRYCTTTVQNASCIGLIQGIKTVTLPTDVPLFTVWYTTTGAGLQCALNLPCNQTSTSFAAE